MIVLDSSGSMADDDKLAQAQEAAKQYLATLPADVKAGLVTFADEAAVKVAPTEDRAAVIAGIDGLDAQGSTALNDAVVLTVEQLGSDGSRNAVLLSDGEDEGSETTAKKAASTLKKSGVVLDAVLARDREADGPTRRFRQGRQRECGHRDRRAPSSPQPSSPRPAAS